MKTLAKLGLMLALVSLVACSSKGEEAPAKQSPSKVAQPALYDNAESPCAQNRSCTVGGRCERHPEGSGCRARMCKATDADCIEQSNKECRDSSNCAHSGQCTSWTSLNAEREKDPEANKELGCVKGAVCCVVSDADCQKSHNCTKFARCTAQNITLSGQDTVRRSCVIASDADCAQSGWCKNLGDCIFIPGDSPRCGKAMPQLTAERCKRSPGCGVSGICGFEEGKCVHTDEGCRASNACKIGGACSLRQKAGVSPECLPLTDNDCVTSRRCIESGACHLKTEYGRTTCVAKSQTDCQASSRCKTEKRCRYRDGLCIN